MLKSLYFQVQAIGGLALEGQGGRGDGGDP
jgi:hypothetical protein